MWMIFLLYAVFSITFPLGKAAMAYTQPIFFVGVRMIYAGLLLLGYQYFFTKEKLYIKKEDRGLFIHLSIFAIFLSYCLQYWALPCVSATKWALLYTITPFVTAFFSFYHFQEKLTLKKTFGLTLALLGLLPALIFNGHGQQSMATLCYFSIPDIAILLSVVCYSYGWVIARRLVKLKTYSPVMINGVSMFFGGILSFITSGFLETWHPFPVVGWYPFVPIVIAIAGFNIFSYIASTMLLKKYTATFLTFMSFVDPIYVALLSWIFLGETITWHFFAAIVLFVVGLFIFYQEELRQGYIVK